MRAKKRVLVLGVFSFLIVAIFFLLLLNGYGWIGSMIALPQIFGFFLLLFLSVGCFIRSFFIFTDRRILKAARQEEIIGEGRRLAVHGTIAPKEEQLFAPFSGKRCVMYEYQIFREVSQKKSARSGYHPEAVGWAFVPFSIKSGNDLVNLLDYPQLMDFPEEKIEKHVTTQFIQQAKFLNLNRILILLLPSVIALIPSLSWFLFLKPPGKDGEIKSDIDYTDKKGTFYADKIEERIVSPDTPVIAIGAYDSKRNAFVSDWIGLRLISAKFGFKDLMESLRARMIIYMIGGIFFFGCWVFVLKMMSN